MRKVDLVFISWMIFSSVATAQTQSAGTPGGLASQAIDRLNRGGDSTSPSPPTPEKLVEIASDSDADAGIKPGVSYEEWVEKFEKDMGVKVGISEAGRLFFEGKASIRVGPLDPNFGKELVLAYERAISNVQADFILQTYGVLQTAKRTEVFEDASTNSDDFSPTAVQKAQKEGKLSALFDKALTVMGKKLDAELIKQGVPPANLNRMSIEQKKTTYKNNFTKETIRSAVRSMQGLVPVQTRIFTEATPNGKNFVVGVIAVQSEKTRQFARDMAAKRPTAVRGTPMTLSSVIPDKKSDFLDELGFRFIYDEKGRPMLLSYGRWSVRILPDWAPSRVGRAKENATETARANAEAAIVSFMNTNVAVSDSRTIGSLSEELVGQVSNFEDDQLKGVSKTQQAVGETIDKTLRNVKATATGDLRGTVQVKRWEDTDQNGILHVGSVVVWSYDQLNNANAIERENAADGRSSAGSQAGGLVNDESRSSRVINRKQDF